MKFARRINAWLIAAALLSLALTATATSDVHLRTLQQFSRPPRRSNATEPEETPVTTPATTPDEPTGDEVNATDTAAATAEEPQAVPISAPEPVPISAPEETATETNTSDTEAGAASETGSESAAEAPKYNQGVEACIYSNHPTTLVDTVVATPTFSTLLAALNASGLVEALSDPSTKLTVFAPTDDAFAKLLKKSNVTAEEVLGNKDFLTTVLKYHVVGDVVPFEDFTNGQELPTLLKGESLSVSSEPTTVTTYSAFGFPTGQTTSQVVTMLGAAANATIIQGNVWTCNAVVQVIDEVLLPNAAVEAVDK